MRTVGIGLVVALAATVVLGALAGRGGSDAGPAAAHDLAGLGFDTVVAERVDLTEEHRSIGEVGHGPVRRLASDVSGTVTWRPEIGESVEPGATLVRIDDRPLHLAEGTMPLYRPLERRADPLEGPDVRQLQQLLVRDGFDIDVDGVFGAATDRAVRAWQRRHGFDGTGRVDATQVQFEPGPVRIAHVAPIGQPFDGVEVTDVGPVVTTLVEASAARFYEPGAPVRLEVPAGDAGIGEIAAIERTAGTDGRPRLGVSVRVEGRLPANVLAVEVVLARPVAEQVIALPARALVPLADGSWIVEIVDSDGRPVRRPVSLGRHVGGLVEIRGGVEAGDLVVVPL